MRRILFPLLTLGLVSGLLTLGSGAFFSAESTSEDNTITTGTLGFGETSSSCTLADVVPGETGLTCSASVTVGGSLDNLFLNVEVHGVPGNGQGDGDFGESDIIVTDCSLDGGACPFDLDPDQSLPLACTALSEDADPSDAFDLELTIAVSDELGNEAQGDTLDVQFHFGLTQPSDTADRCHPLAS